MERPLSERMTVEPAQLGLWEILAQNDPTSPALLSLVRFYLEQGKPEDALALAERIALAHPYLVEANILAARSLLDLNRKTEAGKVMAQAGAGLDRMAGLYGEMAGLFSRVGDEPNATLADGLFQAFSRTEPPGDYEEPAEEAREAVPTETLAALYLAQGHVDRALDIYAQLVDQDPENEQLLEKLSELRRMAAEADLPSQPAEMEAAALEAEPVGAPGADLDFEPAEMELAEPEDADTEALSFVSETGMSPPIDLHAAKKQRIVTRLVKLRDAARRQRKALETRAS